jgi:hypothetical protein
MKLKRVIFKESCEAPGGKSRVAYLQSTEPLRRDSFVADMRLVSFGVMAGDEIYPLHMIRRMTVDVDAVEEAQEPSDLKGLAAHESDHLANIPWAIDPPKKRGRPSKA